MVMARISTQVALYLFRKYERLNSTNTNVKCFELMATTRVKQMLNIMKTVFNLKMSARDLNHFKEKRL